MRLIGVAPYGVRIRIETADTYREAAERVHELLDGGWPREAVEFADDCDGPDDLVQQLRALACTDGGCTLGDRALIERGAELWRGLGPDGHPGIAYNLANAEWGLWELAVKEGGYVAALERSRHHLHAARDAYARVGADTDADPATRVQALTNLGNSYDSLGRDVDALERYDEALAVDPTFGMALGNKGVALLGIAPFVADHVPAIVRQAADALDAALADRERVLAIGGPSALQHFEGERGRIDSSSQSPPVDPLDRWHDRYLDWCLRNRLFLHVSPECLTEDTELLDPLFFQGVMVGFSKPEQRHVDLLVDAFGAIKQDYLAARYTAWLTTDRDSPIRDHAAAVGQRAAFLDSLAHARWGVRTGMALQAFTAAINVLDKVASFVHLYFAIERRPKVYFRTLWHPPTGKGKPDVMHSPLAAQMTETSFNRGLLALCDLSCDLERPTPLNGLVERRHTATHRFLVTHNMLLASHEDPSEMLERVEWDDIVDGTIRQLHTARAALVYLARTIDISERRAARELEESSTKPLLDMPLWTFPSDLSEID